MRPAGSGRLAVAPLLMLATPSTLPAGCDGAPPVLKQICQVAAGAGSAVSNAGSSLLGSVGDATVHAVTKWVIDGAVWFLGQVADIVTSTTKVDVTASFFTTHYAVMAGIAAVVVLPLLLLSVLGSVLHGDPSRLARAVAMTFAAALGTFAAVTVTGLLLPITDDLSARIASSMGTDLRQSLQGVGTVLQTTGDVASNGAPGTGAVVPLFAGFLAAIVVVIGALGVWIELVLRQVAIYGALLFFPLALSGLVWDATARWARRLAEIIASLILAKLIIVALLSLGVAGLASGGFSDVIAGAAMLLLALFAPWVVLRIVGVAQVALAGVGLDGVRGRIVGGTAARGSQAVDTVRMATMASGGSGNGVTVAGAGGASAATGTAGTAASGAAASGVTAGAAGVIAAGKAAGEQVRAGAGRAMNAADAVTDPYAAPPAPARGGGRSGASVRQMEARLSDASG